MKLRAPFRPAASVALCGAALALSAVMFHAKADEWDKRTVLTVDQPIQVTDTYLPAGTYVFKLATLSSERHVVQIFNADESHIVNTILAIPNYRLQPTGNSRFLFWETPPGNAKALRAWFYPGDNFGQEFTYPKHLHQLVALNTSAPAPAPVPAPLRLLLNRRLQARSRHRLLSLRPRLNLNPNQMKWRRRSLLLSLRLQRRRRSLRRPQLLRRICLRLRHLTRRSDSPACFRSDCTA